MNAYVLVTAARNEAAYIGKTLDSVAAQTILPLRWVIVSDASTDGTDDLVRRFQARHPFISLCRLEENGEEAFGRQVFALRMGYEQLRGERFDFVGMLDADISLEVNYYERVMERFSADPRLGIAGGWIWEPEGVAFRPRTTNSVRSVAGAIQLFRRDCYEAVGGYLPLRWGGFDTVAEMMARMRGWEARAFPDLPVYHHKPGESCRRGIFRRSFTAGKMDYSLRISFGVEVLRCLRRVRVKPYILGSLVRFGGYLQGALRREPLAVPQEVADFLRKEYRHRLGAFTHASFRLGEGSTKTPGRSPDQ
jgi:hypothetical protein